MSAPRWSRWFVYAAFALALLRGVALLGHTPLLALANSFDEARYTGCFDLFPDRPAAIRPDTNSPEAPFQYYAFMRNPTPLCYASSDLAVQAASVGIFKIEAAFGAARHSVRWIGALRLVLLLGVGALLTRAWWRRGLWQGALVNAAVVPLLLLDPGNSIYYATFYAEPTALLALYALLSLVLLWHDAGARRWRVVTLAGVAFLLATAKIQHLALPLALAAALLLRAWVVEKRWSWQGLALVAGGVLGLGVQLVQLARPDDMMASIRSYNRADVLFMGLLPAVDDPAATLARLELPSRCIAYVGKRSWELPDLAERACPGVERIGRGAVLREFLREPAALGRFLAAGALALHPWLPDALGHVEGEVLGKLPEDFRSASYPLERSGSLRALVFGLPLLAALLTWRRRGRYGAFALLAATAMAATFGVTLFGDGLADVAKQCHLVFNAALGFALASLLLAALELLRRRAQDSAWMPSISTSSSLRQMSPSSMMRGVVSGRRRARSADVAAASAARRR